MNSNTGGDQKANLASTVSSEQNLVVSARAKKQKAVSPKTRRVIIAIVSVCVVGGVFLALVFTGIIKLGRTPTPGLAKAVCERRGGTVGSKEEPFNEFESGFNCMKNSDKSEDGINSQNDFQYYVYFLKEDSIESYKNKIKREVGQSYIALEESDDYLKYYAVTNASPFLNGTAYVIVALYKNAYVMIQTMDYKNADAILSNLGFPKRNKIKDPEVPADTGDSDSPATSEDSENSSESETSENAEAAENSETQEVSQ